jgi:hypothetical protein
MASRKKRLEFVDYDDAMKRVEQLRAKDDDESDEYEAAIEAATQFFLRDNDAYQFNKADQDLDPTDQKQDRRKWPTIKELMAKLGVKSGRS